MKRVLFILAVAAMAVGCLEAGESYYTPNDVYFIVSLQDGEGHDLLDSTTVENWVDKDIYCTFQGETYHADSLDTEFEKKGGDGTGFVGLEKILYTEDGYTASNGLYFGLISGLTPLDDDVVLFWPDGSTDTVHISNYVSLSTENPRAVTQQFFYMTLNGLAYLQYYVLRLTK